MTWKCALKILWEGNDMDDENVLGGFKLVEHFGEAIPQFVLTMTFLINSYDFVYAHDCNIFPIPTTTISLILSVGSIVMELFKSLKSCCGIV